MKDKIPMKEKEDAFAAVAIALLLILTAWGNAIAMMIGAVVGLIILFVIFEGKFFRGSALALAVGVSVVLAIAIAFFLGWKS